MRLIDADALILALGKEGVIDTHPYWAVRRAPTVDPFIHSSWTREEDEFGYYWSCSNCRNFSYHGKTHYCPHCGAKMDEDKMDRVKVLENEEDKGHAAGGRG